MDLNLKEHLIRSVDSIKSKIRDMKNVEDNTDIVMKKILKPVTEPITALVKQSNNVRQPILISKEKNNNDSGTSSYLDDTECGNTYSDDADCGNGDSTDSEYEDLEYEDSNQEIDNGNSKNIDILKRGSLQKDDLISLYNNTIGVNVPFGIRNENENLLMGRSTVKLSKTEGTK